MEAINKKVELPAIKNLYNQKAESVYKRIVVCAGTGCIANGAMDVHKAFEKELTAYEYNVALELFTHEDQDGKEKVHLSDSGCQGFCAQGPLITIYPDNILYVKVKTEDVREIVEKTIIGNETIEHLLYHEPTSGKACKGQEEIPFYKRQQRLVLENCGVINPSEIEEYISKKGYEAAYKAYHDLLPQTICSEIEKSGLRGRGGGGFPTGKKWELTRIEKSDQKYVICNGDEGDPGAFMDRSLMEGNPHRIIEGMMIAARAIGATKGFIYVRKEYPLAVRRMKKAITQAKTMNILGESIMGSDHTLDIEVMEGAGAFVCGEETALIASVEGKRGMPNPKPPFPAQSGLWGQPTLINNVETLAAIPLILRNGAGWFSQMGTTSSKGTKTFALTGHVANTGLIEVPFGATLREIVYNIGGGVTNEKGEITNEGFKAVQIGGPSGGCLTIDNIDMPLDYENLIKQNAMVGSGGLVVMNNDSCMIQIARFFMNFTQNESCGKCVPCREGTKQMLAMLDEIISGDATMETIENLEDLGSAVKTASLCGLGKTAPSPVLSTLQRFRDEYLAHVEQKKCPTNKCQQLATILIDQEKCIGCTACARKCPVDAIKGEKKQAHTIDNDLCIKCGVCAETCKFNAIIGF